MKTREDSLNTSTSSDIRYDLFTESLKEPDCVAILLNCIKKMEKQITQIFDNTNELKEKQIKGESHLQELSDAADFVTKKFDKYEHESKKREEIINNLMENVAKLTQKSRYPLRSCGKTRAVFDADEPCIKAINEYLDLGINGKDVDRKLCIGNPRNGDETPRPVISKLVRYSDRKKVFDSKKRLKGKMIAITESLTATRMKKLNEARKNFIQGWVGKN